MQRLFFRAGLGHTYRLKPNLLQCLIPAALGRVDMCLLPGFWLYEMCRSFVFANILCTSDVLFGFQIRCQFHGYSKVWSLCLFQFQQIRPLPEGDGLLYWFSFLFFSSFCGNIVTCSLGTKGGATTFALAKVKNAIGRIGIFSLEVSLPGPFQVSDSDSIPIPTKYWSHRNRASLVCNPQG